MGMVSQFCGSKSWIFSGEFVPLEEAQVQFKLLKSPTLDLNNNSKCLIRSGSLVMYPIGKLTPLSVLG